ncbi:unnamed protein product [Chironomus riparius]|uniref:Uncharacterized protein n=1 Tax=Chironomus riparius TaxID=315576 RepID=A0A9P0NRH0_9DIPT|nr:unnamed protein product [Chironomus riparius]
MKKINSQLIDSIDFSSISDIFNIPASKKVINIPNCPSINSALDFLTSNAEKLPKTIFILVFNIQESKACTFERQKLQILSENLKNSESERIFVFQPKFRPTKFLCKIKNQTLLTKIELSRNLHEDEFTNFLITNELIFKAIMLSRVEAGICGVYDYSFLNVILDVDRHFLGLKLVDYALINFDSLSLKFLQLFGIDLSLTNENGDRPLETAAKCGNFCGFLELLRENFEFLTLSHQPTGFNLLMLAAENGNPEIMKYLLELDIFDVNFCVNEKTALKLAMTEKKLEAAAVLVEHDAKYSDDFKNDFTEDVKELHRLVGAAECGRKNEEQIMKIIQKYPKTRNFFDSSGQSAMKTAIQGAIEGECLSNVQQVDQNCEDFIEFLLLNGLRMGKSEKFPGILTSKVAANPLFCDYIHKILSKCIIKNDNEHQKLQSVKDVESAEQSKEALMDMIPEIADDYIPIDAEASTESTKAYVGTRCGSPLESEAFKAIMDQDVDETSNDGSDFELIDNSDTESLVCKFKQSKIDVESSKSSENSPNLDLNQQNSIQNSNKMLIDALKLLTNIPETKILLEIFGLYENVKIILNLNNFSLEIKENSIKLDIKAVNHVQKSGNCSSNSSTYDDSYSDVSSLRHALQSFDIISSASSTSCEIIDDDVQSVGSVASDRTLNSFSSYDNLSIVSEKFDNSSDFEEIEPISEQHFEAFEGKFGENSSNFDENLDNFKQNSANLVQKFDNFSLNLQKLDENEGKFEPTPSKVLKLSENFDLNSSFSDISSVSSINSTKLTSKLTKMTLNSESLPSKSENFAQILIEKVFNFVIFKVFDNNLKPFYKNDTEFEVNLNKFVQKLHEKYLKGQIDEVFVKHVFENQDCLNWGSNLLSCVPKMCSNYAKNNEKMLESRKNLRKLFELYENLTIEFKNHLSFLKVSTKVAKLNENSTIFDKISKMSENFKWENSQKFKNLKIFDDFNVKSPDKVRQTPSKYLQILLTNSSILTLTQIFQEKCENYLIFVDFENFLSENFQNEVKDLLKYAYLIVSADNHHKIIKNLQNFEVMSDFSDKIVIVVETDDVELINDENIPRKIENFSSKCENNEVRSQSEVRFDSSSSVLTDMSEDFKNFEIITPENEVRLQTNEVILPNFEVILPNLEVRKPNLEVMFQKSEVIAPKSEVNSPKSEILLPNLEVRKPNLEVMPQESEVNPTKSEVNSPKSEIKLPNLEVRKPNLEVMPQESEVNPTKSEVHSQKSEIKLPNLEVRKPNLEVIPPKREVISPKIEVKSPKRKSLFSNFEVISIKNDVKSPKNEVMLPNFEVISIEKEVSSPKNETNSEKSEVMADNLQFTAYQSHPNLKIQILTSKLNHKVSDFTEATKRFILERKVDFQGSLVKFSDIISTETLKRIDEKSFKMLINDKETLKIGQKFIKSEKFYFDRKFVDSYYIYVAPHLRDVTQVDSTKFFIEIIHQKLILLCDEPGMGKTTTLKQLQFKFKEYLPSNWVIYVDLKRHGSIYEDFKDVPKWNYENFTKFFTKIQNLSEFEVKIFNQLLLTEKVVFLIDSVDEITQKHKDFIINFTKDLYKITNCHIWIGMRPYCINEYRGAFSIFAYHLEPVDSTKLLDFFIKTQKLPKNEANELRAFVEKFTNFNQSCKNPLFINIVLEIYDQLGSNLGFYMIYEKYVWKKFGISGENYEARPEKSGNNIEISQNVEGSPQKVGNNLENSLNDEGWPQQSGNQLNSNLESSNNEETKPLKSGFSAHVSNFSAGSSESPQESRIRKRFEFFFHEHDSPIKVVKLSEGSDVADNCDSDSSEKDRRVWPANKEVYSGVWQDDTEILMETSEAPPEKEGSLMETSEAPLEKEGSLMENSEAPPEKEGTILIKNMAYLEIDKNVNFSINASIDSKVLEKVLKNIIDVLDLFQKHQNIAMKKFIDYISNLGFHVDLKEVKVPFTDAEIVELSSYDIIYGTTADQTFFIHQTFYEFFVASFIVGKIFEGPEPPVILNQIPTIFSIIFTYREFEVIAKFIEFYVKDNEERILARNNKLFKCIIRHVPLLGTVKFGNCPFENFNKNFHRLLVQKHFNLAKLVLKMFKNEEEIRKIFEKISQCENLLFLDFAAYGYSDKDVIELLMVFKDALTEDRQKKIFKYFLFDNFTFLKENLLKLSENGAENFFGIFEVIFTEDELKEIFKEQINADQENNFCRFLNSIHKLSIDDLTSKNLEILMQFSNKFLDLDQKFVILKNFAENLEIVATKNQKIFKVLENFTFNLEKSELSVILKNENSKLSKIFLNFVSKKIKSNHFIFLLRLISENLEEFEIFNIIENDSNLKIKFFDACSQNMSENIEIFTNFINKFLPTPKMKEFLLQKDPNGQFSTIHFLFQNYHINFERIFTKHEIKNLILTKNSKNETILFEIFRKNQKLSENFFILMLEVLNKTEIKLFLCHKSSNGQTAFQVFGNFLKNYENISLGPTNFQEFLADNFDDSEVMDMVKE